MAAVVAPILTDETSDAEIPHFHWTWRWGGTIMGTWDDEHLHVFADGHEGDYGYGYMKDGRVVTTIYHTVYINDGVKTIGNDVFREQSFMYGSLCLTTVLLPDKDLERIGDNAFRSNNIGNMAFPENIKYIGSHAFDDNPLSEITIPDSLRTIGESAFEGCHAIKSVKALNLESIGNYAFKSCASLDTVSIAASDSIGEEAFKACSHLKNLRIAGTTKIGDRCFEDCKSLSSANLSYGVSHLGTAAFKNCSSLKSVAVPGTISTIFPDTFRDCVSLKDLRIYNGVTEICYAAFINCSSLVHLSIPDSVVMIGNAAFKECGSLETVVLGRCLEKIGEHAWDKCPKIKAFYYHSNSWNIKDMGYDSWTGTNAFYTGGKEKLTFYSPGNIVNGKIFHDTQYLDIEYKCTWKNYDGTVLYKIGRVTDLINPVYDGPTPTHPDGLTFCGWSEYLDDTGNTVNTALFQKGPLEYVGGDDSNAGAAGDSSFLSKVVNFITDIFTQIKD